MTPFRAVYANFKPIPSRKVVSIVLEAPIELGDEIIKYLGMPNPEQSKWVAVARLQNEVQQRPHTSTASPPDEGLDSPGDPKKWDELPYPQRAGILANSVEFLEWTGLRQDEAVKHIRTVCGVKSRSEILPGTEHAEAFDELYKRFDAWRFEQRYA